MRKFKRPHETTTVVLPVSMLERLDDVRLRQSTSRSAIIRQCIALGLPVLRAQTSYGVDEKPRDEHEVR